MIWSTRISPALSTVSVRLPSSRVYVVQSYLFMTAFTLVFAMRQWSTIDCMNIVLNINYIYYKYLDFGVFLYEPSKLHWFKAKQVLISPQTLLETIRRLESDDSIIKYLFSFNGTFRRYGGHFEYFVSSSFPVGCSWDKFINFAPSTSHNGCKWNSRIQNCRRIPKAQITSPRIGVVELL